MLPATRICEFCNKYIEQAATQKRHYYYCRAKHKNPGPAKKRACSQCVAAKTRCDLNEPCCYSCRNRNQKCSFADLEAHEDQRFRDSLSEAGVLEAANDSKRVGIGTRTQHHSAQTSAVALRAGHQLSSGSNRVELNCTTGGTSFAARHRTRGSQKTRSDAVIVHLNAYLDGFCDGSELPPFIHRSQLTRSNTSQQHPLATCQALFKSYYHKPKDRAASWRAASWLSIQAECDRLWLNHESLGVWELLATMQALLLFAILRCLDNGPSFVDFDIPFLMATSQVARTVGRRADDKRIQGIPDAADVPYEKWVFQEAHRRTVCVYRVLNMVYDLSEAVCQPVPGYLIVPLPMPDELWEMADTPSWATQFAILRWEQALFGLDDRGRLMKLRRKDGDTMATEYHWPMWSGANGRLGGLIATAAMVIW